MKFTELNNLIPYAKGGKEKILRMSPYPNITLAMPGRHAKETVPIGGDFVVMVKDGAFIFDKDHQFTHTDIFKDIELRREFDSVHGVMDDYLKVVQGEDPDKTVEWPWHNGMTVHTKTFMYAVQCLAIAEHRRYAQFESKFGGRYLPFRFSAGIAEGLWTAADAANLQKRGRPGVEILERTHGVPLLTKELMND